MATYSPESLGIKADTTGGVFQQGAWYGGRQYWNGTLGEIKQIHPESNQVGAGNAVSNEVVAQTNPNNVSYLNSQIQANKIQSPQDVLQLASSSFSSGLMGEVDTYRKNLETTLAQQKLEADTKLKELRTKEAETLGKVEELSKPFREQLETAERERLYINENFEANQGLINELEQLLTEGNNLIKQQQEITGLAAVRNPRIQKAMNDVAARAGVIQAVISARNGQIAQAENLIDRSISAIAQDRAAQLDYYEKVLSLNNRDIISLDEESKRLAQEQLNIIKVDLERAQATADYVKQLMVNPATAALMGEAGVSLNDSVEQISSKLSQAEYRREVRNMINAMESEGNAAILDPSGVPKDQLITLTDAKGTKYYFKVPKKPSGTISERSVTKVAGTISTGSMSFADAVVQFANQMTLAEIYAAYSQSTMGEQFGPPKEPPNEIALIYKISRGEISAEEARDMLE